MSHLIRDQVLAAFEWTQSQLENSFNAIPPDQYMHQPFPGANHALWMMGHLATVDQFFLKSLAGADPTLYQKYKGTFFAKSQPSPDPANYPAPLAVRQYFDASRAAFRAWVESLDDEMLLAPLPTEQTKFSKNLAELLFRLVWHEGMHYGQLTVIRKSLGLPPVRI
jgi:uncharacterized damage-inducible protein DinB